MSKKLKKLGKVAAGLGAAYALSQMGKASGTDTGTLDTEQEMISRNDYNLKKDYFDYHK